MKKVDLTVTLTIDGVDFQRKIVAESDLPEDVIKRCASIYLLEFRRQLYKTDDFILQETPYV